MYGLPLPLAAKRSELYSSCFRASEQAYVYALALTRGWGITTSTDRRFEYLTRMSLKKVWISYQFDRSDDELYHKTYDLHVLALQKPFIESEGRSPGFISFRVLAQVKAEPRRAWSVEGRNRGDDGPYGLVEPRVTA